MSLVIRSACRIPATYNYGDDNDGDGLPDPINYTGDAQYFQDSNQFTIMSYFDSFETGAQNIDWNVMRFLYPSTPMVDDVYVVQQKYGADMTTRTGNTTYGFNATADVWQRSDALPQWRDGDHLHDLGCRRHRHAGLVGLLHAVGHRSSRRRIQQCRRLRRVRRQPCWHDSHSGPDQSQQPCRWPRRPHGAPVRHLLQGRCRHESKASAGRRSPELPTNI